MGPFSFIPTLAGPSVHTPDNRAFYDYGPAALNMPHNLPGLNGNPNGHRGAGGAQGVHNDTAQAYAISNQFSRDQLIQRSTTLQPFVGVLFFWSFFFNDSLLLF